MGKNNKKRREAKKRKKEVKPTKPPAPPRFMFDRFREQIDEGLAPEGIDTDITKDLLKNPSVYLLDRNEFKHWLKGNNAGESVVSYMERVSLFEVLEGRAIWFEFLDDLTITLGLEIDSPFKVAAIGYNEGHLLLSHRSLDNQVDRIRLFKDGIHGIQDDADIQIHGVTAYTFAKMIDYLQQEDVIATKERNKKQREYKPSQREYKQSNVSRLYRKKPCDILPEARERTLSARKEFDHRFHVKGHWRKIEGVGHDADGNLIQGLTWVKQAIKGPKDKPIKNKIRLVKDSLPPGFKRA